MANWRRWLRNTKRVADDVAGVTETIADVATFAQSVSSAGAVPALRGLSRLLASETDERKLACLEPLIEFGLAYVQARADSTLSAEEIVSLDSAAMLALNRVKAEYPELWAKCIAD